MKKSILFLGLLFLVLNVRSQTTLKKHTFLIKPGIGAVLQKERSNDWLGYSLSASGEYFISEKVSIGLNVSYNRFNAKKKTFFSNPNNYSAIPALAVINYYFMPNLYGGLSAGIVNYKFSGVENSKSRAGYAGAVGYLFLISKSMLGAEVRYFTDSDNFLKGSFTNVILSYCFK